MHTSLPAKSSNTRTLHRKKQQLLAPVESPETQRAMRSAVTHFQHDFGGALPCTTSVLCDYIAAYATHLANSTIEQRVRMLARWHKAHGVMNPADHADVRTMLVNLRKHHPHVSKQAKDITVAQVEQVVRYLDAVIHDSASASISDRASRQRSVTAIRERRCC